MEHSSTNRATQAENRYNIGKTPLVEVSRVLDASMEQVWRAWTDSHQIKQWYGPKGFACIHAETNLKAGGRYLMGLKGPDGVVKWTTGLYQTISENEKLLMTNHFSDENAQIVSAKEIGMDGDWAEIMYITVGFKEHEAGRITVSLTQEGVPTEMHDECVANWSTSFDKLQKLLVKN